MVHEKELGGVVIAKNWRILLLGAPEKVSQAERSKKDDGRTEK